MKKLIYLMLIFFIQSSLNAQLPPNPPLQPGESWTNLWSVSYDYQTNGSIRYLIQDPANPNSWCSILMAQQDSNTAVGIQRYIYYSYSEDNGISWTSNVLDISSSFGFPCITLSNGIPVISCHRSSALGSFVFKDLLFGGFSFQEISGIPVPSATPPIWSHIAGTTNGNLVLAASENTGPQSQPSGRAVFTNSWSPYVNMPLINGPSGNFDVASGPNGKVAIIGTNYEVDNTFAWYRSNDNGVSFDAGTIIMNYIIDGGDTLYANVYGGYQAVYDNNGNAHIVFAAYNIGGKLFPIPNTTAFIKPRIYHWSSQTNTFTQIAGRINISNLSDTITQASIEPLCHPTITITSSGKLICAFTAYLWGNTQIVNDGTIVNTGEIFYSVSNDNGSSWSGPQNITNTPNIEEKHPSLSPNTITDSLRIFYLRDMKAGAWILISGWGKAPVYGIFNNLNFNQVPAAPVLLNPQNNLSYISLTPLLDWQNVISAESYMIQLSRDISFNNLIINQTSLTSEYQIPVSTLNYDSIYYWRVNAANSNGTGAWSTVWNFRTTTFLPPAPVLLTPVNGALEITLAPTLDWNNAPTALTYNVQVSLDSNLISPIISQSNLVSSQYIIPVSTFSINTLYYWRVSSTNTNGTGSWSFVWRFRTVTLPAAPILTSPSNGSTGISLTPLLDWNNVSNAARYRIQLSVDSNFINNIINDSTITVSQYEVPSALLNFNTKYYWRVNGINEAGTGLWSLMWNFTTTTSSIPPAPLLILPANGASNVSITPLLDWNNVSGAISYRVQIGIDLNFNFIILDESNITNSQHTIPSPILGPNSLYFWRVNATNSAGTGPWSSTWNFRTQFLTGLNLIGEQIPVEFSLFNNYPNPFNPSTKIKFNLPESGLTELIIFDLTGREVTRLIDQKLNAGSYEYEFLGDKHDLSSGIYFYRLISGDFTETKRMLLIK
ncbi:MAG: T9SS type A sorting domain-containing protein [Bacteroidota bacterium]|nr:T9SS type A sorting domain-containing protein [Bacteroidota bacterium]